MKKTNILKYILFGVAILLSIALFFSVKVAIRNLKEREKSKILIWTHALEKKSAVLELTKSLFDKLKIEEKEKVELWSDAVQILLQNKQGENASFLLKIISANKNIPVALVDDRRRIVSNANLDFELPADRRFSDSIALLFSDHPPIVIRNKNWPTSYLYYKDSRLYTQLQYIFDDFVESFISDIIENSVSVPVIITDSTRNRILFSGNVDTRLFHTAADTASYINMMASHNSAVNVTLYGNVPAFVYYEDSNLLVLMQYVPLAAIVLIGLFLIASFLAFNTSRVNEQNLLWVGMSKETAHQLGTPISSLMAWAELIRMDDPDSIVAAEMEKDISRLKTITERFSKIGSEPQLSLVAIATVLRNAVGYMQVRTSDEVVFSVNIDCNDSELVPLNADLFEWCIENIIRNAIDAMSGRGAIVIHAFCDASNVYIDITDSGKGIPRRKFKKIFTPGFTTKSRGWGLGLSLARRIIADYHNGKVFVKRSEINVGTTFRILLPKKLSNRK